MGLSYGRSLQIGIPLQRAPEREKLVELRRYPENKKGFPKLIESPCQDTIKILRI